MGWTTRVTLWTADVRRSSSWLRREFARVCAVTDVTMRTGALLVPTLLATAAITPAAASGAASSAEFFGTNFSTLSAIDADKRTVTLSALRDARMTLNRIDVHWDQIEPVEGRPAGTRYNWGDVGKKVGMDYLIWQMAQHDLRASPLFRFPPSWAGDGIGNRLVPDHYDEFGQFIAAFAKRYGPEVTHADGTVTGGEFWKAYPALRKRPVYTYELWNEVNLDDYAWSTDANSSGNADPAAYAALAATVRDIVKPVLPRAILLGSLSWKDRPEEAGTDAMVPNYVPKLAAQGGLGVLDGMGFHPYAPDAAATIDLVVRLRHQLAEAGYPNLPIFADEAGQEAVTVDPSTGAVAPSDRAPSLHGYERFPTDASRAANLAFAGEALAASDCGVKQFLPYGVSGPFSPTLSQGALDLPRTEAWMGLYFPKTGLPTLSAQAMQRASLRWASRFDPGGPGAPASLALCGGGESPAASVLKIDAVFTGLPEPGCAKVVTTYDSNPLEAAYLRFYDPATGRQVAEARTDARGAAEQCVPWDLKGKPFRLVANLGQAGISGTVDCDVPGVGCPAGVDLTPQPSATLSARAATGYVDAQKPPATVPKAKCTHKLLLKAGKFTKDKRGSRGRQRLTASLTCPTAAPGTKLRFQVLRRAAKGGKERVVKTLWLTVSKPRVIGVPGMRKGERVVLVHRAEPRVGLPRLRESLRVGAQVPRT